MESVYYPLPFGCIHALCFGRGAELLIALHGFGDQGKMFAPLEPVLGAKYTLLAVDLPFHGQSDWQKMDFSPADLRELFNQILQKEGKTTFALMGFSFGARLAQALLPELVDQLNGLYLLSPDGWSTRGLTWADRTPMWFRKFLWKRLKNPGWLLSMLEFARKNRLIPAYAHSFLRKNLSHPDRIQRTFGCWLSMNAFPIRRDELTEAWMKASFLTRVYVGSKDPLLDLKALQKQYETFDHLELILLENTGHQVIGERLFQQLG